MIYKTKFINNSATTMSLYETANGNEPFTIPPHSKIECEWSDPKVIWAKYSEVRYDPVITQKIERDVFSGEQYEVATETNVKVSFKKNRKWKSPFGKNAWIVTFFNRCGEMNEKYFVSANERYYMPYGIPVDVEVPAISCLAKFKMIEIAEPLVSRKPDSRNPGYMIISKKPNVKHIQREPMELDELKIARGQWETNPYTDL